MSEELCLHPAAVHQSAPDGFRLDRRHLIKLGAVGALSLLLPACGSQSNATSTPRAEQAPAPATATRPLPEGTPTQVGEATEPAPAGEPAEEKLTAADKILQETVQLERSEDIYNRLGAADQKAIDHRAKVIVSAFLYKLSVDYKDLELSEVPINLTMGDDLGINFYFLAKRLDLKSKNIRDVQGMPPRAVNLTSQENNRLNIELEKRLDNVVRVLKQYGQEHREDDGVFYSAEVREQMLWAADQLREACVIGIDNEARLVGRK